MTALPPRWLAAGGAAVLAALVGVALLLQTGAEPACAAPPTGNAKKGKATFYDMGGGTGNCSFPSLPGNDLFVALGAAEYAAGAACGMYLDVTGPKGKVRVKVVDSCPPCTEPGHIDLSRAAFGKIADHVTGIIPITYKAVANPPVPGPLSITFEGGSSRYWFAFNIDNHGNALRSVQVRTGAGGSWVTAARQKHNVWVVEGGAGAGPFNVRMTDVRGRTATATGVKLAPDTTQRLSARFGGAAAGPAAGPAAGAGAGPAAAPEKAAVRKPAKATPSNTSAAPSPSASSSAPASASASVAPLLAPPATAAPGSTALALTGDARRC